MEGLLAEHGVIATYETIRRWCRKFGRQYANTPRRRRPRPGDTWHLDEVFVQINGVQHYRWWAVDQGGQVRDILVRPRRDTRTAVKFLRKLLKGPAYVPRVVITDELASDGAAMREVLPGVEHRRHKGLQNRAENAHQPARERERRMRRFKSPGRVQRFLAACGPLASLRPCLPAGTEATRRTGGPGSASSMAITPAATSTGPLTGIVQYRQFKSGARAVGERERAGGGWCRCSGPTRGAGD